MQFNVNTTATVKFTNKLEKIQKSALPVAIRSTLNDAVFDVKTRTMPESAKSKFVQRRKNFFTANSKFEGAKGFSINSMKATVGFYENKLTNAATNYAVKDLEQQEHSGTIDGKAFIPMNPARVGGKGAVRANARLKAVREKGIINTSNAKGVNYGQMFIKSVIHAGVGGYVLGMFNGKEILWRVNSINRTDSGQLKLTALYSVQAGRSVHVEKTEFMKEASLRTESRLPEFYAKNANKQLQKYYDK